MHRLKIVLSVLSLVLSQVLLATPQLFNTDSYQHILKQYADDDFIVLLWSLDCPPCIEELPTLQRFHREYPEIKLIMISADDQSQSSELHQLITKYQLNDLPQWVFVNQQDQRLRYSIDPGWYGELPRSYFYKQGQLIHKSSGRITLNQLQNWQQELQ